VEHAESAACYAVSGSGRHSPEVMLHRNGGLRRGRGEGLGAWQFTLQPPVQASTHKQESFVLTASVPLASCSLLPLALPGLQVCPLVAVVALTACMAFQGFT